MPPVNSPHSIPSNPRRAFHRSLWLCAAALVLCAVAHAQELKHLTDKPGTWRLTSELRYVAAANLFRLKEAEHKALAAKMDTLVSVVRGTAVFNPPVGFFVAAVTAYDIPSNFCLVRQDCTVIPAMPQLNLYFYDILAEPGGQTTWDKAMSCEAHVRVNDLEHAISAGGHIQGAQTPEGRWIWLLPQEKGRIAGFPTYNYENIEEKVVLAKPGRRVFVPITREEFISALIYSRELRIVQEALQAHREDQQVNARALQAERLRTDERLQSLRAELARLGPAERASPAWYAWAQKGTGSGLVAPGAPNARQLVSTNPAYFDRSLPRSAIQLISTHVVCTKKMNVDWSRAEGSSDPAIRAAHAFFTAAEWQRVAALIQ